MSQEQMCISFSSELPLSVISLKRLQYLLPKTFLTFWSGVYLWVCQITCPTCLVPYTLSCLTCLLPYLLPYLTCLVPFLLLCLTCLVPYVLLCLTCFVFYTCFVFCASSASCASRALVIYVPLVPPFSAYCFVCFTYQYQLLCSCVPMRHVAFLNIYFQLVSCSGKFTTVKIKIVCRLKIEMTVSIN